MSAVRERRRRAGFTLMELMVVVAIVAILAGLVSTAVVNVMHQAASSRIDNQIARLQAAILQYRHDYSRWPIPERAVPTEVPTGSGVWKLKYCSRGLGGAADDNSAVVEYLLHTSKSGSGRPPRDILDLHGFSAVAATNEALSVKNGVKSKSYEDWGDAWAMSEPDDDNRHKNAPTLVWRDRMYYCDSCGEYNATPMCRHRSCPYFKSHQAFRKLPSSSRREVAKPFYIMFDFSNDRVLVQRNPE